MGFVLLAVTAAAFANSVAPMTPEQQVDQAAAVCRASVLGGNSYRDPADGGIYTRTVLRLDEALKGRFPASFAVVHRGGTVGMEMEVLSSSPGLRAGEERLLFLGQRSDGTLFAQDGPASARLLHRAGNGFSADEETLLALIRRRIPDPGAVGADVTSQAAIWAQPKAVQGLLTDTNGISSRFLAPDRGEPIEYLVDTNALPSGISPAQAMNALSNAFKAWSDVTSLKFAFAGYQDFGMAPADVITNDQRIRIQLHDLHHYIPSSSTLGIGGRVASISLGAGGLVAGNEFYPTIRGSLVLNHTNTQMQELSTFEEVMTHELGHVLSLAHSSENPNEPDTNLTEAMMYFRVHGQGRGSTLGAYDVPIIRQIYPPDNTPPYSYDRVMDIVTQLGGGSPDVPGINEIELRGYDRQGAGLSPLLINATSNSGVFTLNGSTLKYTPETLPPNTYNSQPRLDPAEGSAYDSVYVRFSDGANASPFVQVRVISYQADVFPIGANNGLPDEWMTNYFGSADPAAGPNRGPNDDADGDGISNLNEFLSGTNPTNAADALKITSITTSNLQWLARPYDVYEVQGTTDFTNWFRVGNPVLPTTAPAKLTNFFNPATNRLFLRIIRVP